MAGKFAAQVKGFTERAKRDLDLVVVGATQRVAQEMTQPKDGLMRGAAFETGVVPVNEGQLIGSVVVQVNGSTKGQGNASSATPPDYVASLAGYEAGQTILVGFTAPYARHIEYGFRIGDDDTDDGTGDVDVPGRFMVRLAVQEWDRFVQETAALFKD